jgi:uncharacterized protein (TIGR03435 family)
MSRRRWALATLLVAAGYSGAPALHPQTPTARPSFEVASIKLCENGEPGGSARAGAKAGSIRSSPGNLHLGCQTLETLIQFAYLGYASGRPWPKTNGMAWPPVSTRLLFQTIKGSPRWVTSDQYTIDAKPATPQSDEMMRGPTMQALLEGRFKLRIHRESRDLPVYFLTVARSGARLQPARPENCIAVDFDKPPSAPTPGQPPRQGYGFFGPSVNGPGIDTFSQTMSVLCLQLSGWLDRDVIDKTGLTGKFDIHLDLSSPNRDPGADQSQPPVDPFGDISAALQRLGLKLEAAKAPGDFLVIDHIERPSEN